MRAVIRVHAGIVPTLIAGALAGKRAAQRRRGPSRPLSPDRTTGRNAPMPDTLTAASHS